MLPTSTARLSFRWWTKDDLQLAQMLWGDPRVTSFIDARPQLDRDAVSARLTLEIENAHLHGMQYWPMFHDGSFVGASGLKPTTDPAMVEMGFYLLPQYWGVGLATEAARAVVSHAFDERGVRVIGAGHHPENRASKRTLEKLGFRYDRETLFAPTGLMHPYYLLVSSGSTGQ